MKWCTIALKVVALALLRIDEQLSYVPQAVARQARKRTSKLDKFGVDAALIWFWHVVERGNMYATVAYHYSFHPMTS